MANLWMPSTERLKIILFLEPRAVKNGSAYEMVRSPQQKQQNYRKLYSLHFKVQSQSGKNCQRGHSEVLTLVVGVGSLPPDGQTTTPTCNLMWRID